MTVDTADRKVKFSTIIKGRYLCGTGQYCQDGLACLYGHSFLVRKWNKIRRPRASYLCKWLSFKVFWNLG